MYFGLSQQSKHSRDIAAILKFKKNELDVNYIEQWAACVKRLGRTRAMLGSRKISKPREYLKAAD